VGLDGDYAPAWAALGLRYYYDGSLGTLASYPKAAAAAERALALDPNLSEAMQQLIVIGAESGNLGEADRKAREFLRRRPQDPHAHFAVSYVLRYAGLLEDAARECDAAHAADPRGREFRSCALVFVQLGKYDRAREYLRLDAGSLWVKFREAEIFQREGNTAAAVALLPAAGRRATLLGRSGTQADRDREAAAIEASSSAIPDPEGPYIVGGVLASAGYPQAALRLLRKAVEGNYLCVPAMDNDPLFASVRKDPEFAAIRAEAMRRQKEFIAQRATAP
jgi:hypothetical protein